MTITIDDKKLYEELMDLLTDYKLVNGPQMLQASLIRHPKIKKFLTDYQKREIIDLESNL